MGDTLRWCSCPSAGQTGLAFMYLAGDGDVTP